MKAVFAFAHFRYVELCAPIMCIVVQKTTSLNKIDKHQSVKHQRSVPIAVRTVFDTFNKFEKSRMLFLKFIVKTFGNFFGIAGKFACQSLAHIYYTYFVFLGKVEKHIFKFLIQCFGFLPFGVLGF